VARTIKSPAPLDFDVKEIAVFLAGSIEMGAASEWQKQLVNGLQDLPAVILNPRREAWDTSSEPSSANPQFRQPVEWELEALERADLIAMYFEPATKSPIALLELGLFARSGKLIVCCPDGYWRKGNIELVCPRYHVPLTHTLPDFVTRFRERLQILCVAKGAKK
jgi:hypothetical protein